MKNKKVSVQLQKDVAANDWRLRQLRKLDESDFVATRLPADAHYLVTTFAALISQFSEENQPEPWDVFEFAVEVADMRRAELSRQAFERFRDSEAAAASGISFADANAIIQVSEDMAAIRAREVTLPDADEFQRKVAHLGQVIENLCDTSDRARRELREVQGSMEELDKEMKELQEELGNTDELIGSVWRDLQDVAVWRSRRLNAKKHPAS